MGDQNNRILEKNTIAGLSDQQSAEGSFIDDFSHLRLSYYQHHEISFESMTQFEECNEVSKLTNSNDSSVEENATSDTILSELGDRKEIDEKQKLRNLYISQIPDLPHPSYTVASIIAAASHKMGFGNMYLKYENKIDESSTCQSIDGEINFDPKRRSTLKPNEV